MSEKMTSEEFSEQWHKKNPLRANCGAVEWADHACKAARAYRRYDPVGYDQAMKAFMEIKP